MKIKQIASALSREKYIHLAKGGAFLLQVLIQETYTVLLWELFNIGFTKDILLDSSGRYLSIKELKVFSKKIAEFLIKDDKKTKKATKKLVEYGDNVLQFIQENNDRPLFLKNAEYFFNLFKNFFAYHVVVKFSADFVLSDQLHSSAKQEINKLYQSLEKAFKKTEQIIPKVSDYMDFLGISWFLPEELLLISNKKKPFVPKSKRAISLIFLSGKRYVLPEKSIKKYCSFLHSLKEKNLAHTKSIIKGQPAYKGYIEGKARVIIDPDKMSLIHDKDIIVVKDIRPEYFPYARKAATIIADEGGALSHAATLAREFHIPCIIGTHKGTKLIADGDVITVDANKGEVSIIR